MRCLAVLGLLALTACGAPSEGRVDPRDHDAFFLWAGVHPPPVLAQARTVYILAGEVHGDDRETLVPLRSEVPRVQHAEVWLTLRAERLDWSEAVYRDLGRQLTKWQAANPRFAGLQIDFDAKTRGLEGYAEFLGRLRARLPRRYRLSVTGLMDWSANGDPAALARLAGVVIDLADHFGKVTPTGVRIDVRLTHGALAEMTGTTRETLTKVSGWLRTEDIASIERRMIWVSDWDALVEVHEGGRCMPGRTAKLGLEV